MDDIRAVMDAAGSERAAIFGLGDAGPPEETPKPAVLEDAPPVAGYGAGG
jgi:hypothetical protein